MSRVVGRRQLHSRKAAGPGAARPVPLGELYSLSSRPVMGKWVSGIVAAAAGAARALNPNRNLNLNLNPALHPPSRPAGSFCKFVASPYPAKIKGTKQHSSPLVGPRGGVPPPTAQGMAFAPLAMEEMPPHDRSSPALSHPFDDNATCNRSAHGPMRSRRLRALRPRLGWLALHKYKSDLRFRPCFGLFSHGAK